MGEHLKDIRLHQLLVGGDVSLIKELWKTRVSFLEMIDPMVLAYLFSILEIFAAIRLRLPDQVRLSLSREIQRTAEKEKDDWPGLLAPIRSY